MSSLKWNTYMEEALIEAQKAKEMDEVPVGCIVIDGTGNIIGRGYNSPIRLNDPCAHAEILAIRQACARAGNYRLTESYLISTLEPCLMCVGAIIHSRIRGVVFGCRDEKAGALVSRLSVKELSWVNHKFWIKWGVMENRCRSLLQDFFKKKRKEKNIRRGTEVWS